MLLDWVIEFKDSIDRHGIRWGVFFTLLAIYRKEKRNLSLDKRDEALFHNDRIIMEALGVGEQWHGPPKKSKIEDLSSLKKSFSSLQAASNRGNPFIQRRKTKMNTQNINWATLAPCLLGAVKLILQPMGINIPDQNLNEIANGIAALATVIGIIYSHRKQAPAQPQPNSKTFIQG